MINQEKDSLDSSRRFVLGVTGSARLEVDFFNLYAWLLRFVTGKKVLDVACGSGLGSFLLAHKAKRVTGIDLSSESIAFAKERYNLPGLEFIMADFLSMQLAKDKYDVVISAMTLEQMAAHDQEEFLIKLHEVTADNGICILITPNKRITSPSIRQSGGHHWNKHELNMTELDAKIRSVGFVPDKWLGRRRVFSFWSIYLTRKAIGLWQKIIGKNLGFYGVRESAEIKPINIWWQPKEFVVILRK